VTIPKHDEIRLPALSLLAEHGQLKLSDFEAPLAEHFDLGNLPRSILEAVHEKIKINKGRARAP
jgi:restriction system protein